jgi:hypothetical protein
VCWALLAGGQSAAVDDGEPSGTAGRPMLEVLRHQDLEGVLATVVRYYGGINLGAGGLVRAYTDAVAQAALAIDPLIQSGVQIDSASGGPTYQLRGFNDLKAPLLAQATANAKEQAAKFAAEAGAELGALRRANQGVIQITGDDGGDYDDGSSRTKRLRVVSTFEFMLR